MLDISTSSVHAGRHGKDMEKCNISAGVRDIATVFGLITYFPCLRMQNTYYHFNIPHHSFPLPVSMLEDMEKCNILAGVRDKVTIYNSHPAI
jgi:hypothetical protein